jgi:hypothetical protein
VQFAMMPAAEGHRKLIADFLSEPAGLGELQSASDDPLLIPD